ncbi:MAG: flagellar motor protein MotB [Bryobacteraceae bacterium]
MRKKRHSHPENHERWLVSYADFITLLFAFFVVMFASARSDKARVKAVSEAIDDALKNGTLTALVKNVPKKEKQKQPDAAPQDASKALKDLSGALEILKSTLQKELGNGSVRLALEHRGLVIELEAGAFFPSGGATLDSSAYPTVEKLAAVLNRLPNALRLEGHTDSLPINNSRFQSNWELSAARSIAMLRFLNEQFGVATERMAIVGYADTEAIDSNDTEAGREHNRRVDIVVVSSYGMQAEPAPGQHVSSTLASQPASKIDSK